MLVTGYKDHKEIVPVYMRKPETSSSPSIPFEEEKRVPCKIFIKIFVYLVNESSEEEYSLELLHINLPGRGVDDDQESFISFDYRFDIYIMNEKTKIFTPLEFDCRKPYQTIYDLYSKGVSEPTEYEVLYDIYESATIQLPKKNIWNAFFSEFITPLLVFQIFSIILWFYDSYYYYSLNVLIMLIITLIISFYELMRGGIDSQMMINDEWDVIVTRQDEDGNQYEKLINSSKLVPGDLFEIRSDIRMPWDAVLLSGSVVINESVLTGESTPVIKWELPHSNIDIYDPMVDKKYTLYAGTEVLQTKYHWNHKTIALVVRTNYDTAKGKLIKNFLFPKPDKYRFEDEANYFIFFCFCSSILLWGLCLYNFLFLLHNTAWESIDNLLNLITQLVPPSLPTAIVTGIVMAMERLKRKNIYSTSPSWINSAGRVNIMVFD